MIYAQLDKLAAALAKHLVSLRVMASVMAEIVVLSGRALVLGDLPLSRVNAAGLIGCRDRRRRTHS